MQLMKKTISIFILILILLSSCSKSFIGRQGYLREYPETVKIKEAQEPTEYRAIWFSYLDYSKHLSGLSEDKYKEKISAIFSGVSDFGFNTVIFQVLPHSDSLYKSEIYPTSALAAGALGGALLYDPLEIATEAAHEKGLKIEAWINPFRAYTDSDAEKVSEDTFFGKWYKDEEARGDYIVKVENRWYYNPAHPEIRDMIAAGVGEIARNSEVDGIHLDEYFYPTTDASFDEKAYLKYGGSLELSDFRRDNVNQTVKGMYEAIKAEKPSVYFGISPVGNIENCYEKLYADIYTWVENEGYADYIAPQLYYSFKQNFYSYTYALEKWKGLSWNKNVKFYIGLSAYKLSGLYTYSTEEEKNDWESSTDMLARQLKMGREAENFGGFAVFSYSNFFPEDDGKIAEEKNNLKALL